jgi:type II secretory pathway component GspD/PulD (secretin)
LRANLLRAAALALVVASLAGCGAGKAFKLADQAARVGDWETAVRYYEQAVEADPNSAEYKIALERARLAASREHLAKAAELEGKGDLEGAIVEYRRVTEYEPVNRRAAAKVTALEQTLRDRAEAARPKPAIEQMKEKVKQAAREPVLSPTSRQPLDVKFAAGMAVKQILEFLGQISGINVLFESTLPESQPTKSAIDLSGVTLEQALTLVMTSNGLFYKVMNPKTILVITDNPGNRTKYEDQVIKTIPLSHAEPTEIMTILNTIMVVQAGQQPPRMQINKAANSITIRGSASVVAIAERVIENNDKPRAEVVIDVEILEVNRTRVKQYGLSLSNYQIGLGFSPDAPPGGGSAVGGTTGGAAGATAGTATLATTGFTNVNTLAGGVSPADFYVALPSAVIKFLESDSKTKLIAKPSLRGSEGTKLTANLGDDIPVPSTSFMPLVAGGTAMNPMTSFTYRPVGVLVAVTPRVTYDGDIILDLEVESSTKGSDVNIGGQNLPAFGSRKVSTRMRLRDGESNLLAGLLRDDERKSLTGFPGGIHVPVIKQLFSANDEQISQTDIVMLLTPHIIRTQALTERNLQEIYIGTAQNPVLGGVPPLIGQTTEPVTAEAPPAGAVPPPVAPPITTQPYGTQGAALVGGAPVGRPTPAGTPVVPPGASPIPGTVMMPPAQAAAAAPPPPAPPAAQGAVQAGAPPAQAGPPVAAPPAAQAGAPVTPPPTAQAATPAGAAPPAQVQGAAAKPPAATPYGLPATPSAGAPAQVTITVPGPDWRVGQGPYTLTLSALNMTRVSTVTLTLTYNPTALKLRSLQEGSFMRVGVPNTAFAQQADNAAGRIDITISRSGDVVGATGSGPLAAVVFDAVAPGTVNFRVSGMANGPGGTIPLQFSPATVTVK